VNCQISWFWLKFREGGPACSDGPLAARFLHDAAAASGVLVPGTVTALPANRTNRLWILDAINQPPASRNLSQNQLSGTF